MSPPSALSKPCLRFWHYKIPWFTVSKEWDVTVFVKCNPLKLYNDWLLHGPSMFAVKAKIYGVSIINPVLSLLMKHLVIGQRQKAPNFSAFHWSPHGNLVSIGQHFVTTRVVHLPKRTETSLITESDQRASNRQLCSYAPPAQPGPTRTRLCGPCIAAIAGY